MRRVEHVMGFPVSLRVDDEGFGESAVDDLFAWLREAGEMFRPSALTTSTSSMPRKPNTWRR